MSGSGIVAKVHMKHAVVASWVVCVRKGDRPRKRAHIFGCDFLLFIFSVFFSFSCRFYMISYRSRLFALLTCVSCRLGDTIVFSHHTINESDLSTNPLRGLYTSKICFFGVGGGAIRGYVGHVFYCNAVFFAWEMVKEVTT